MSEQVVQLCGGFTCQININELNAWEIILRNSTTYKALREVEAKIDAQKWLGKGSVKEYCQLRAVRENLISEMFFFGKGWFESLNKI